MCIIAVCKRRLTADEFKYCADNNSDGWGIGIYRNHIDSEEARRLPIFVDKGYICTVDEYGTYDEIVNTHKDALHVVHFRQTSTGKTCPELTHPFPLDLGLLSRDEVSFGTNKSVLFHNGHYSGWDSVLISLSTEFGMLPGELSDTKILAWALTHMVKGFGIDHAKRLLEVLDDKFVLMNPNVTLSVYGQFFDSDDKLIMFSNMSYKHRTYVVCG